MAIALKYGTNSWDSMKFIRGKVFHKVLGFVVTIGSQVTVAFGLKAFYLIDGDKEKGNLLMWLNVGFFFTMLLVGEIAYQVVKRQQASFNIHMESISR